MCIRIKSLLHLNWYHKESLWTDKEAMLLSLEVKEIAAIDLLSPCGTIFWIVRNKIQVSIKINWRNTKSGSLRSLSVPSVGFCEHHTDFSFHFHAAMCPPLFYPPSESDRWPLVDLVGVLLPGTWQGPWRRLLSSLAELKGICVSSAEALPQFLMVSSTDHEGRIKLRPRLSLGFGLCSRAIESNTFCLLPELLQTAAKAVWQGQRTDSREG